MGTLAQEETQRDTDGHSSWTEAHRTHTHTPCQLPPFTTCTGHAHPTPATALSILTSLDPLQSFSKVKHHVPRSVYGFHKHTVCAELGSLLCFSCATDKVLKCYTPTLQMPHGFPVAWSWMVLQILGTQRAHDSRIYCSMSLHGLSHFQKHHTQHHKLVQPSPWQSWQYLPSYHLTLTKQSHSGRVTLRTYAIQQERTKTVREDIHLLCTCVFVCKGIKLHKASATKWQMILSCGEVKRKWANMWSSHEATAQELSPITVPELKTKLQVLIPECSPGR